MYLFHQDSNTVSFRTVEAEKTRVGLPDTLHTSLAVATHAVSSYRKFLMNPIGVGINRVPYSI